MLLCLFDLVFSFGSVLHYAILLEDPSAERPIAGLNVIDAIRSKKALGDLLTANLGQAKSVRLTACHTFNYQF
jgi:hypothetical protein